MQRLSSRAAVGRPLAGAVPAAGAKVCMKIRFSMNAQVRRGGRGRSFPSPPPSLPPFLAVADRAGWLAQTVPGERENVEISERRFERDVMSANIRQLLRRKEFAESGQDVKKRRKAEMIFRKSARGRKIPAPETWEDFFGDEMLGLGMDTDFEDLDFEFLTSVSNVTVSPFEDMFMDPADSELYGYEIPDFGGEPASA